MMEEIDPKKIQESIQIRLTHEEYIAQGLSGFIPHGHSQGELIWAACRLHDYRINIINQLLCVGVLDALAARPEFLGMTTEEIRSRVIEFGRTGQ
jgi:hypothetical protein